MKKITLIKWLFLILVSLVFILELNPGFAAQIKLAWDPNTEPYLAGYKIYWGNGSKSYGSPIDVGNVTQYTLTGLTAGNTYFIAVTAYGLSNNESGSSNEVSGVAKDPSPNKTIPPVFPSPIDPGGPKPDKGKHKGQVPTESSIYVVVSETAVEGFPFGNIKKYEISTMQKASNFSNSAESNSSNNPARIQVVDSMKSLALDSNNVIKDSAKSQWSSHPDGKEIDKGGVGEVLLTRNKPRNIFTFLGDINLKAESNAFEGKNEKLTSSLLGVGPTERDRLIQYIHGYDSYARRKEKDPLKKRRWLLGGIESSRPLAIPYENSQSVIFVGANDGMLHAFDNATGEELWGFIPYELLGRLKDLPTGNGVKHYVDGSPKAYITGSQKIIIFSLGKGGSHYYALDVTNPENPRFLWKIGPETTGFSKMGQTWSTPQIGKIKYKSGEKVVFFIGGGYDENQDGRVQAAEDKKGRVVYLADLLTGEQVWRWDHARDPNMKYSIPSDISSVDTNNDGYIDRFYVGDTGGRLWRFDISEPDPIAWAGSILFNSNAGITGGRQKIFSRPDVTLERGYELVFFGTGDREHPDETKVMNQIYAVKDKGLKSTLIEKDLENVTDGVNNLKGIEGKEGWFMSLENRGEKALASPVIMFGVAYFTTFTPSKEGNTEGIARLYALSYKNGGPILDLNPKNNTEEIKIDLSDRSRVIGTGIPSGVIISAIKGRLIAFTGFQGGVYQTPLRKDSTIIPIWWREVRNKK